MERIEPAKLSERELQLTREAIAVLTAAGAAIAASFAPMLRQMADPNRARKDGAP